MAEKHIYAQAKPASVKLSEYYFYEKKLSRNPYIRLGQTPVGKIEIVVPYDGDQCFSRQAVNDIKKQLSPNVRNNDLEARIGHLSFINYERTDLRDVLRLNERYGSFPLSVPILGQRIKSIDQLYSDTLTSTIAFDYSPKWPDITPVDVSLDLWDEETLNWYGTENPEGKEKQLDSVAKEITQQVNFRRSLLIQSRLWLNLPSRIVQEDEQPKVIRMSLKWPTVTSFRGLHLRIGNPPKDKEARVRYNPETKSLEWGNVPMTVDSQSSGTDAKTFSTDPMYLFTDYPGELYKQICLEGQAEIEIPGLLLSETQVRLFNVLGERTREIQPKAVSYVNARFELILDEAFARRKLSPYQHLYFDEVIPDEMRIADIKTAITDRGFRIVQDKSLAPPNEIKYFITAVRPEGPDTMELSILIEGMRKETERETQVKGGQKFRSNTESGYLRVYIRGEMPGNHKRLTQEMNAFQTALHDRFERLRSRR